MTCPPRPVHRLAATAAGALLASTSILGAGVGPAGAATGGGDASNKGQGARASACTDRPVATDTREAAAVFVGTVTSVTAAPLTDGRTGQSFTQDVEVSRVYDGRISSAEVVVATDRVRRTCSVGALSVGSSYVFFVEGQDDTWQALGGQGTAIADVQLVAQVQRLLGSGRAPVAPAPEQVDFTDVALADPIRLTRAAAPGAALAVVGLLGLVGLSLARRRSRRKAR